MPSLRGTGLVYSGEHHYIRGPRSAFWKRQKKVPVIFYGHGAGGNAQTVSQSSADVLLISELSKHFLVIASDWGGISTFGNTLCTSRYNHAKTSLSSPLRNFNIDLDAPVGHVGASQGAIQSLNYTRAYNNNAAFIAGLIPLVNLQALWLNPINSNFKPLINAAYNGSYIDSQMGLGFNPMRYANLLPVDLPIHLYCAEADTATPKEEAYAFQQKRLQTGVTLYPDVIGHNPEIYVAALEELMDFCRDNAPY